MTYPYAVKFNGKWYRPNEDVPDTAKPVVETARTVEESAIQPVISQVKEVQPEKAVEDEPKRRGRKRNE
jgi:hypothetical protein